MTQPSTLLSGIVDRMQALMPTPVKVLALDAAFGTTGKDFYTTPRPAVVVSLDNLVGDEGAFEPPVMMAALAAYCVVDVAKSPEALGAVDLAALVSSIVQGERWRGAGGEPLAFGASSRLRATNENSPDLASDGLSIWVVHWQQPLELTPRDTEATLRALRTLTFKHKTGTDDGGLDATLELEGAEVP